LWDIQLESGFQDRVDPNWILVSDSNSYYDSYWQSHPSSVPGRTWTAAAGMFLNDNFRLGLRLETVTAHGAHPSFLDSSVVSGDLSFFTNPAGPFTASFSLRAGIAPGFPRRDPPGTLPFYFDVPPRVYAVAAGVRWMPLENLALDCDLGDVELWSGSMVDTWHFSWLTPRLSFLF
jgi:hypothetical protein